jgi:hypothetical protein
VLLIQQLEEKAGQNEIVSKRLQSSKNKMRGYMTEQKIRATLKGEQRDFGGQSERKRQDNLALGAAKREDMSQTVQNNFLHCEMLFPPTQKKYSL